MRGCGFNFKEKVWELKLELLGLNQEKIANFKLKQNIKCKFNPLIAPYMAWVVSRKSSSKFWRHQCSVSSRADCWLFSKWWHFTKVETILNNDHWPLIHSDHVDDLEALTPNHLLIERNFCKNSDLGESSANDLCSTKRWRQVQLLIEHFWKRWLK